MTNLTSAINPSLNFRHGLYTIQKANKIIIPAAYPARKFDVLSSVSLVRTGE